MHLVHKSTRSNWFYANVILTILILAFFFISVVGVEAHTTLENTSPKSQERLNTPPSAVELWFQDEVEVSSHSIKITNHEGAEVQEEVWINPEDDKHVTVTLKEDLPPGEYRVSIHVLAPDGDPLRESFSFMIKEPQFSKEEMWLFLRLEKSSPEDGLIVKSSPEQIEL